MQYSFHNMLFEARQDLEYLMRGFVHTLQLKDEHSLGAVQVFLCLCCRSP